MPALVMFAIFVAYPFLQGFPISFTKWDGMSPNKAYVGLKNYIRIFQDGNVMNAVKNTLLFTAVTMVFSNLLGLLFALMISKKSKLNNVLRTCIFMPYCLSLVLSSYIWRYVYSDVFYDKFGIASPPWKHNVGYDRSCSDICMAGCRVLHGGIHCSNSGSIERLL